MKKILMDEIFQRDVCSDEDRLYWKGIIENLVFFEDTMGHGMCSVGCYEKMDDQEFIDGN
jgi:hypothetical protein